MEVVVITGVINRAKLQPNHHQQTKTQFCTDQMTFLSPKQESNQSAEGNYKEILLQNVFWDLAAGL